MSIYQDDLVKQQIKPNEPFILFDNIRFSVKRRATYHDILGGEEVNDGSIIELNFFGAQNIGNRIINIKTGSSQLKDDDSKKEIYGELNTIDKMTLRIQLPEIENLKPVMGKARAKLILLIEEEKKNE